MYFSLVGQLPLIGRKNSLYLLCAYRVIHCQMKLQETRKQWEKGRIVILALSNPNRDRAPEKLFSGRYTQPNIQYVIEL